MTVGNLLIVLLCTCSSQLVTRLYNCVNIPLDIGMSHVHGCGYDLIPLRSSGIMFFISSLLSQHCKAMNFGC